MPDKTWLAYKSWIKCSLCCLKFSSQFYLDYIRLVLGDLAISRIYPPLQPLVSCQCWFQKRTCFVTGDGASDMVWRLRNGEAPAAGQVKQIVLLIGSNDLDYYWDKVRLCPPDMYCYLAFLVFTLSQKLWCRIWY